MSATSGVLGLAVRDPRARPDARHLVQHLLDRAQASDPLTDDEHEHGVDDLGTVGDVQVVDTREALSASAWSVATSVSCTTTD